MISLNVFGSFPIKLYILLKQFLRRQISLIRVYTRNNAKKMAIIDFRSLLSELTLEEKVALLSGKSFTTAAGVSRLGIPPIKVWLILRQALCYQT
jgi:hypothetical protein